MELSQLFCVVYTIQLMASNQIDMILYEVTVEVTKEKGCTIRISSTKIIKNKSTAGCFPNKYK